MVSEILLGKSVDIAAGAVKSGIETVIELKHQQKMQRISLVTELIKNIARPFCVVLALHQTKSVFAEFSEQELVYLNAKLEGGLMTAAADFSPFLNENELSLKHCFGEPMYKELHVLNGAIANVTNWRYPGKLKSDLDSYCLKAILTCVDVIQLLVQYSEEKEIVCKHLSDCASNQGISASPFLNQIKWNIKG